MILRGLFFKQLYKTQTRDVIFTRTWFKEMPGDFVSNLTLLLPVYC